VKALIDADILVYSCGFSAEKPIWRVFINGEDKPRATFRYKKELNEWVKAVGLADDEYKAAKDIEVGPVSHALSNAKQLIERILLRTGADEYQLYLTGKGNYREEIATILPYKGNRDSSHKPHHYDSIIRYLTENWGAITVEGIEADDAMSTAQMSGVYNRGFKRYPDTCIATIDKDLDMVPGNHYNWNKDVLYFVDEETAMTWFYAQLIMGDATDNIQGIPGAGKKKAEKVLSSCETEEDMYWAVLDLYQAYYSTLGYKPMDALIENARLLWMRREEGVNWNPPV